jgi:hypothetical protein
MWSSVGCVHSNRIWLDGQAGMPIVMRNAVDILVHPAQEQWQHDREHGPGQLFPRSKIGSNPVLANQKQKKFKSPSQKRNGFPHDPIHTGLLRKTNDGEVCDVNLHI